MAAFCKIGRGTYMERLDKILSNLGFGSRKEVKALVKSGVVKVHGNVILDSSLSIDPDNEEITVNDVMVQYRKYIYIMLNKPQDVVSATFDNYDTTVIDLLDKKEISFKPAPVGRLDKDTEGFLLLTNDGPLNHRLTSPKYHVNKVYYAEIDNIVTSDDIEAFNNGITIDDGYKCREAKLEIIKSSEDCTSVYVTIQEGKFHQVKRMFEALNKNVIYLKRIKFGPLELDEKLNSGEYRELSENEIDLLKNL